MLALLALSAVLHLAVVRGAATDRLVRWLEASYPVRVRIGPIDYSLLRLEVTIRGLAVSAAREPDLPFLEAREIVVNLAAATLIGRPAVDAIDLVDARVFIHRLPDGPSNRPSADTGLAVDSQAPFPSAGRVTVDNLDVFWSSTERDMELELAGLDADFRRIDSMLAGRFELGGDSLARHGTTRTTVTALRGHLAYDGRSLTVDDLVLDTPEGRVQARATIDGLRNSQRLDATYRIEADSTRLAPWLEVEQRVRGALVAEGTVSGPLSDVTVDAHLSGKALAWNDLDGIDLDVVGHANGYQVDVSAMSLAVDGNSIAGRGTMQLAETRLNGTASWRALETRTLARAFPDAGWHRASMISDGTLVFRDTALSLDTLDASLEATNRARAGAGTPLAGLVRLEVKDGRANVELRQSIPDVAELSGRLDSRLDPNDWTDSSVAGHIELTASRLDQLVSDPLIGPSLPTVARKIAGSGRADLQLGGTVGQPVASGPVTVDAFRYGDQTLGDLAFQLRARPDFVDLASVTLMLGANAATGDVSLSPGRDTIDATFDVRAADLARLRQGQSATWWPEGTLAITGRATGRLSDPEVEATLDGGPIRVAGQAADRVTGRIRLHQGDLVVESIEMRQGDGHVAVAGRYGIGNGRYDGNLIARDISLQRRATPTSSMTSLSVKATASLELSGQGTLDAPEAGGWIQLDEVVVADRAIGNIRSDFALRENHLTIVSQAPALSATLRGGIGTGEDDSFDLSVELHDTDLDWLSDSPGDPGLLADRLVAGTIAADARVWGQLGSPEATRGDVGVTRLDARIGTSPLRLVEPGRITLGPGSLDVERLVLAIGETQATLAGRLGADAPDGLVLRVAGDLADLTDLAALVQPLDTPAITTMRGALGLTTTLRGTPASPVLTASLELDDALIEAGELPAVTNVRARVEYDGDSGLAVNELSATWQDTRLAARLDLPIAMLGDVPGARAVDGASDRTGRLSGTIESISAEVLAPFLGEDIRTRLDMAVNSSFDLTIAGPSMAQAAGDIRLTRAEFAVGGVQLQQARPTVVRLSGDRLEIVDWNWTAAGNEMIVTGGLDLGRPDGLDMTVRGEMDLRLASAFLPNMATAGHASINVRVGGSPTEPIVGGYVTLADAELRVATPRLSVTNLDGAVALTAQEVAIEELVGLANGGSLRVTGRLLRNGFSFGDGTLTTEARGVALDFPTGLRTEIDADLRLDVNDRASRLSGLVSILRGAYREPLSMTTQLLATLEQRAATTRAAGRPSPLDDLRLDVGVVTREDIFVDNNYGRLTLGGTLRLIGTVGRPALSGRTSFGEGGVILLGGNVYQLESGSIDFTNPAIIEPEVDVRARTSVSSHDISLHLSGTPDVLETELSSDPPLGQSDIVSLLLTGRKLDAAGNAGSEVAREQVLGYLSGEFAGVAGRAIGLDVLRLDQGATTVEDVRFDAGLVATETNPGSRLTFGKRISEQLELIFSQSLQETGDFTWIVDYSPIRQADVRFVSRDNQDRSYQFWHDLSFAGPESPGTRAASRRPTERIDTVRIEGRPGFDDAELARQLQLSTGDRFDFYRWQADRDRLLRYYHERDFLEAQIRTQRVASDQPDIVSIQYDVSRGPRTSLTVDGATLPSRLLERIRERWTRSTFDEFLVQDLERMTRVRLASQGFLQARVEPTLTVSGDRETKTIHLQIETGPAYENVRVSFTGAEQVDAGRLESLVRAEDLVDAAFVDPSPLIDAVSGFLREGGLLDAEVAARAPVFDGTVATLPLDVREGPLFQLGEVVLTGVKSRVQEEIRAILDLPSGSVFSQAALDAARQRLSADYRRLGFNAVEVGMTTEVAQTSPSVLVQVTIDEGPRQILQGIVVEGAGQTRPGFVDRALGFTIGEPVDLQGWYQARKRLYDTGAFRRVDLEFEPETTGVSQTEPVRARVLVEEWPRYRLRYGFQLNDERAPVGESDRTVTPGFVADLIRRNLFGRAFTAGISTRVERRDQTARTFLSMPSLFGLPVTSNVFAARTRTEFGDGDVAPFVTAKYDMTLEQRFAIGRHARVAYGYNYQRSHTFERDPDPIFPFDITVDTARLTVAFTIDTRDDLLEATRGWFHSSSVEYASSALGSDLRFGKYLLQQYYFQPLPGGVVLASAMRVGMADGYGQEVIPSERFFAGGGTTVRGFAQDSLGARDVFGGAQGGEALFILNQEVRFPLLRWLQGVGFLDAGRPFRSMKEFSLADLDASVGFGLRVRTPFVVIRMDYGQPLSRFAGVRPAGRWVFSIGQMF